jgi:hypothetical protein
MSGIDDLMAEANERWSMAARRAQGVADRGLGGAVKTYYTRYFPASLVILIAAAWTRSWMRSGNQPRAPNPRTRPLGADSRQHPPIGPRLVK